MKTLSTICILFIAQSAVFSQAVPKFELTKDGVAPIVLNIDSMSAGQLYQKTINWVQETYKNPEKVLVGKIEDEMIRIEAFMPAAWSYKALGQRFYADTNYSFQVDFKDNRIRLTFTPGTSPYRASDFFKDDGSIRGIYKDSKPEFEDKMNELGQSLYTYLKGANKKSNW